MIDRQKGMFKTPPDVDSPYVIATSGVGVTASNQTSYFYTDLATLKPRNPPFQQLDTPSIIKRGWFKAVQKSGNSSWSDVFVSDETGKAVITPAVTVKAPNGRFLGAITAEVALESLEDILRKTASSPMPRGTRMYIIESTSGNSLVAASVPGVSFVKGAQVPVLQCSDEVIRSSAEELIQANFPTDVGVVTLANFIGYFVQAQIVQDIAGLPFHGKNFWYVVVVQPNQGRRI
jgi:hypothetical protein